MSWTPDKVGQSTFHSILLQSLNGNVGLSLEESLLSSETMQSASQLTSACQIVRYTSRHVLQACMRSSGRHIIAENLPTAKMTFNSIPEA